MNENRRTGRLDDLLEHYSVPEPDEAFISSFRAELVDMVESGRLASESRVQYGDSAAIAVAGFAILFSLNFFYTATVGAALHFILPAAMLAPLHQLLLSMGVLGAVMLGLTILLMAYRAPMIFQRRLANEQR